MATSTVPNQRETVQIETQAVDDATVFGMVKNTVYLYTDSTQESVWSYPRPMDTQNSHQHIPNSYTDTVEFAVDDGVWDKGYGIKIADPNILPFEAPYLQQSHTLYKLYEKINKKDNINYTMQQAVIMQRLLKKRISLTYDKSTGNGAVTVINPTYEVCEQLINNYNTIINTSDANISNLLKATGLADLSKEEIDYFKFTTGYENNVVTVSKEGSVDGVIKPATINVGVMMLQFPIGDMQIQVINSEGKVIGWLQYFQVPGIASQTQVKRLTTTLYYGDTLNANSTSINLSDPGIQRLDGDAVFPMMGFNRWFFDKEDELKEYSSDKWYRKSDFIMVQGRYVNVLHTKVPGDIEFIGDDSNQPNVPATGTLLDVKCKGTDKYGIYADGNGGTYESIRERNSPDCGYVKPDDPGPDDPPVNPDDPDPPDDPDDPFNPAIALRYLKLNLTIDNETEIETSTVDQDKSDSFRIKLEASAIDNPGAKDIIAELVLEVRGDVDNREIPIVDAMHLFNGTLLNRDIALGYNRDNQEGRHVVTCLAIVNGAIYRSTPVVVNWVKKDPIVVPDVLDVSNLKLNFTLNGGKNINRSTKDYGDVTFKLEASGIVNTKNEVIDNKAWIEIRGNVDNRDLYKDTYLTLPIKNGIIVNETMELPFAKDGQTGAHTVRYAIMIGSEIFYSNPVNVSWNNIQSISCTSSSKENISLTLTKNILKVERKTDPIETTGIIVDLNNFSCCGAYIWLESNFVSCSEARYRDSPLYHGTIRQDLRMDDMFYIEKNAKRSRATPQPDRLFKFDFYGNLTMSSLQISPTFVTKHGDSNWRFSYPDTQLDLLGQVFPDITNCQREIDIVFNLTVIARIPDENRTIRSNTLQVTYKVQPSAGDNPYWYDCEFNLLNVNKWKACTEFYED